MSLTMWTFNVSRDRGGEKWSRPKVQWWLTRGRYPNLRIGWRFTAWGLHLSRQDVTADEAGQILAAAKRLSLESMTKGNT